MEDGQSEVAARREVRVTEGKRRGSEESTIFNSTHE